MADKTISRATPADAFRRARRMWLKGERIHLSDDLGIGRATLFRWVGNKDLLIGEVLWSLYDPLRLEAIANTPGKGVDFIVGVYRRTNSTILHFEPLRRFINQDPEYALKILTSSQSILHTRTVETNTRMLKEQGAYFMVRLAESCLYSDIIGGREPRNAELEDACTAVRILLGGKA